MEFLHSGTNYQMTYSKHQTKIQLKLATVILRKENVCLKGYLISHRAITVSKKKLILNHFSLLLINCLRR